MVSVYKAKYSSLCTWMLGAGLGVETEILIIFCFCFIQYIIYSVSSKNVQNPKKNINLHALQDFKYDYMIYVSCSPDNHFLEAICCFPMVYYMAGSIDK